VDALIPDPVTAPAAVARIPHPIFVLTYEQTDITLDVTPYVLSVTYTDHLSGESDELAVELEDADGRWIGPWYPGKGDTLRLSLGYEAGPLLPCGAFEIDEIEFSRPPSTVSIRALATGVKRALRTRKPRAFENTTLDKIVQSIAKRNRLTVVGKIRAIHIDRVTQYQERDVAFLTRLSSEYGYAFKVVGDKLVFTELSALREEGAVTTIKAGDLSSLRLTDKIKDIYIEAKGKYQNPKTKELVAYGVKDGQVAVVEKTTVSAKKRSGQSVSGDTLKLSTRGPKAAVEAKTRAALEQANLKRTTGNLSLPGNPKLVAGNLIEIVELGQLSGKYLIDSARHRLERGGGYTVEIDIKRVSGEK
jgi:phage protein D